MLRSEGGGATEILERPSEAPERPRGVIHLCCPDCEVGLCGTRCTRVWSGTGKAECVVCAELTVTLASCPACGVSLMEDV